MIFHFLSKEELSWRNQKIHFYVILKLFESNFYKVRKYLATQRVVKTRRKHQIE